MLRITCYSLMASGLITSVAWSTSEHLSPGNSFARSAPALANDVDFQELMAWVEIIEDRNSLGIRNWLDSQEYRFVPGSTPNPLIDQIEPGMDRVAVRALLGDPLRVEKELDAWVYDTIYISFAKGGVQGWIETNQQAAQKLALRNAMAPLGETKPIEPKHASTGPRVIVASPFGSGSGSGSGSYRGTRGDRRLRSRLKDQGRRHGARRSGSFRKPAFLRSMFSNPGGSSRLGNRRNGRGYANPR